MICSLPGGRMRNPRPVTHCWRTVAGWPPLLMVLLALVSPGWAWQTTVGDSDGIIDAVVIDAAGDVVAAGFIGAGPWGSASTHLDLQVAKVSGASGQVLWRRSLGEWHGYNAPH